MTENEVGVDLIHPEDIGVELPDGGPWRLANTEGVMLMRFGRRTDLSMKERHAAVRHVGVLTKTKREELIMEQEKALHREAEKKKPVDKKNPWGNVAESWAIETRGRMGNDFDDYLAAYTKERGRVKRDWDDPGEEEKEERKSGGVRDRLGWGSRAREETTLEEEGEDDMEWVTKMKKPRMGMVADIVEKGSARNRLGHGDAGTRRKVARRSGDAEDEDIYQDLRQKVKLENRVIRTADRRLHNDKFAGGRLEGRLGFGGSGATSQAARPRLADRLGSKPRVQMEDMEEGREDSLERDRGDDLRGMDLKNMVVKVTRSEDERTRSKVETDSAPRNRDRDRGRGGEMTHSGDREEEIRQRLREIKREKEMIDEEKRQKHGSSKHVRKSKDKDRGSRDGGRDSESSAFINQIKERAKKLEKYKSKRKESSDESDSDSTESDNSDSESSEESSESESESSEEESESNDSSSSDSEEERRQKERRKEGAPRHKPTSRGRTHESKHGHKSSEKKSSKSSGSGKTETAEESKKAEELRDQLRNYLKKAKEAKEKKRK